MKEQKIEKKKTDWGFVAFGAMMVVVGAFLIFQGISANNAGVIIPATTKSGPMTGLQSVIYGVIAVVAGLAFVGNVVLKAFKSKNGESSQVTGPDR